MTIYFKMKVKIKQASLKTFWYFRYFDFESMVKIFGVRPLTF